MSITAIIFIILIPVVLLYLTYAFALTLATNKTAKDELVLVTFDLAQLALLAFFVFGDYFAEQSYLRWLCGLVLIYGSVRKSYDLCIIIKRIRNT